MEAIKRNTFVRLLCYPYISAKRKLMKRKYLGSGYRASLASLKGRYAGERCFVIGNGPSLTSADLDRLKGEYSFAANRIFAAFDNTEWRPSFYSCSDPVLFEELKEDIFGLDVSCKFINYGRDILDRVDKNTYLIYQDNDFYIRKRYKRPIYFSDDPSGALPDCRTVTFLELQLAAFMGFTDIYLLGVDHFDKGKSHFYRETDREMDHLNDYFSLHNVCDEFTEAYITAKEYADSHGIHIYNATRGGGLEVFERVDFDLLFENDGKQTVK